jgi:drug/metabolite transporter (DMT)-like permease
VLASLLLVIAVTVMGNWSAISELSREGWAASWYMAIFPTALAYSVYYAGVQRRGPSWASAYNYLVPPLTAGLDHLFFGAPINAGLVGGTVLVVIGLTLGNWPEKKAGGPKSS